MQFRRGDFFFHYTSREAAFDHILPTGRLRLSPYDRVNDPLENQPWRFAGAFFIDEASPDPQAPERAYFEFDREARVIWGSAKLLALTVDAPPDTGYEGTAEFFGRGWARARMWDQYSERHMGVCLLFDRSKLTASINASLQEQGFALPYHREIAYTEEGPAGSLLSLDLGAIAGNVTAPLVRQFVEDNHEELFFLKTRDWETEFEYRFVVTAPEEDYVSVDYDDALEAVIVGERFPKWQEPGAIDVCRGVGAMAARIDWSMRRPIPVRLGTDKAD